MSEVTIQLLCASKSGTLSRIIRELKPFGLQYQSHKMDSVDNQTQFVINAIGELNSTRNNLRELFESLPDVLKVENLSIINEGEEAIEIETPIVEVKIGAHEPVVPEVLLTAEKRLSEIVGPVASFLVEAAASQAQNAGELYRQLSEELDDERERQSFLSIIKE